MLLWANIFLAVLSAAMFAAALTGTYGPVVLFLAVLTALYFAASCMTVAELRMQQQVIALLGHIEPED